MFSDFNSLDIKKFPWILKLYHKFWKNKKERKNYMHKFAINFPHTQIFACPQVKENDGDTTHTA